MSEEALTTYRLVWLVAYRNYVFIHSLNFIQFTQLTNSNCMTSQIRSRIEYLIPSIGMLDEPFKLTKIIIQFNTVHL